jgi:hypothetical protein
MASLYTQAADRVRLAKRAIGKLANENPNPWTTMLGFFQGISIRAGRVPLID